MKKNSLKKALSLFLAVVMVLGIAPLTEFGGLDLFGSTASAADESCLTFVLINDDTEYKVNKCDTTAAGVLSIPATYEGKSVTSISELAFVNCTGLTSITIPSGVTSIGNSAFYNCIGLTSITIPSGVTSIGNSAFSVCTALTSITIPSSVSSIGNYTFEGCKSLTSVTFGDNSQLTSIGNYAFNQCTALTSVTFGDNSQLTSIGDCAFNECTCLTSVNFGDNSQLASIGKSAFDQCTGLTSIEIPSSVTSIGNYAFNQCTALTSVTFGDNSQLTSIGNSAFSGCTGLTSIEIPSSVTSIGNNAYQGCTGLTSVTFGKNSQLTSIGNKAFYVCAGLTSITFGDNSHLTSIGEYAFFQCTVLTNITIPSGVTSIGEYAFYQCAGLTSITIPSGVTSIGNSAFYQCTGLTSIEIPSSVTSIGNLAFYNCTGFIGITIPSSVTSIGENAFLSCFNLSDVYYGGSEADREKISISSPNTNLTDATWHYNFVLSLDSIAVKTNPDKTEYFVGETLDKTGLTLAEIYNNGTTKTITSGFTCSPTALNTAGTQTITVTYGDNTCTFDVTVTTVAIESIAVKTMPSDTEYYEGDTLDTAGLTLTATYNNGTTETITSGFTCNPTTLSTPGTQTITVTYGGKTCTFNVTVTAVVLKSIAIKTMPSDTEYFVGEALDTTGLTLTATYDNATTKTITSGFTCDPTTLSTSGTQTITVTYGGKTCTFNVTVTAVVLESIAVKTEPTKTAYLVVNTLDTTGLTLTATYNNGKTETITSGFTCNPTALNTAGTQTITVTYGGKTCTFDVTVTAVAIESIAVASMPSDTEYFVGEALDTTGLTLTATYSDGTTATITRGFTCTPTTLSKAGTQTITVTYGGITCTFNVTVTAVVLEGIAVKTMPSDMEYFVGDTLDTTGLTLTATYNNGDTETITSGFTCDPTTLSTAGTQEITVTYGDKSCTFNVTVTAVALESITVKTKPTKTAYFVGDTLDTTGLTLTEIYNNGTTKTITSGFTCSPTALNTAGTQTITVTYGDNTCTFDVTVTAVAIESIAVKTEPTKTAYFVGDTLSTTGLTLTATYNNGDTEEITSGFTCDPTTLSTAGTQEITVTYDGKTCTFDVTVTAVALESIAIKTASTKTAYFVGDTLSTTGLTLTATYNNGSTQIITSGFTCDPTTLSTAGTQEITVTYGDKTCVFDVTVVNYATVAIQNNPGTQTINYGDAITLTALTTNLPTGAQIKWYVNGTEKATGESYTYSDAKSDATITVKIVDSDGNVLTDANGNGIGDTETIKVNACFWQKIVSFFKNLFGISRVTVQAILDK